MKLRWINCHTPIVSPPWQQSSHPLVGRSQSPSRPINPAIVANQSVWNCIASVLPIIGIVGQPVHASVAIISKPSNGIGCKPNRWFFRGTHLPSDRASWLLRVQRGQCPASLKTKWVMSRLRRLATLKTRQDILKGATVANLTVRRITVSVIRLGSHAVSFATAMSAITKAQITAIKTILTWGQQLLW